MSKHEGHHHRVYLQANPNGFGGDTMLFRDTVIGKSEKPLYDAARWLLANNAAAETDTVATYRDGKLSMSGNIGNLAGWTVEETKHGRPSLRSARWRAFSSDAVASRTGERANPGMEHPEPELEAS